MLSNPFRLSKIIQVFIFLLFCELCSSQNDSILILKHYWSGKRKEQLILKNQDTLDYKKFDDYGHLIKHIVRLRVDSSDKKLLLKELFYTRDRIFIRTIYGKDRNHYTECHYWRNGSLKIKM